MFKKISITFAVLAAISTDVAAHSMSPGFQKKYTPLDVATFYYKIQNNLPTFSTFVIQVYDKEWNLLSEDDWVADQNIELISGQTKTVRVKIRMKDDEQKVYVCSSLDKTGYNHENPGITTRVCSRLWRWRTRRHD